MNETKSVLYSPACLLAFLCMYVSIIYLSIYLFIYFVLQKFFDLERENACATKEQKNHTFPKLNRNKYMVTDGAAYIGRYQDWDAS